MKFEKFNEIFDFPVCFFGSLDGVLIAYDQDEDHRVDIFVSRMRKKHKKDLFAVGERKGCLYLIWRGNFPIPESLTNDQQVQIGHDSWTVYQSETLYAAILRAKPCPFSSQI